MINKSIRVYSLNEIHDLVRSNEYPDDFQEYLKAAPDGVKEYLSDIGADKQKWIAKEIEAADHSLITVEKINKNPKETIIEDCTHEKSRETKVNDLVYEEKEVDEDDGRENQNNRYDSMTTNTVDESRKQNYEEVYKDLRFGDTIKVKQLVLHEMKHNVCELHSKEYQKIRVVVSLKKGEFAVRTRCCPLCKKLFVSKENYQRVNGLFDKKKVDYVWIPEGK